MDQGKKGTEGRLRQERVRKASSVRSTFCLWRNCEGKKAEPFKAQS